MTKEKIPTEEKLTHLIYTKVNDEKYAELQQLLKANPAYNMSRLVRDILYKTPVKIITYDGSLDALIAEFEKIRAEIRDIGVNINQITHQFNTYPEPQKKLFFARITFVQYQQIEQKIDRLFDMVAKIEVKWLSV